MEEIGKIKSQKMDFPDPEILAEIIL